MITLQKIAYDWGVRCFGVEHMRDKRVRALRLAEEAIEAAQAVGVSHQQVQHLATVVYRRPHGDLFQELGGVMVTTAVLAEAYDWPLEEVFLTEVRRCLAKPPEHFAERNQQKLDLGLTGHETE